MPACCGRQDATAVLSRTVRRILARNGLQGRIAAQKPALNKRQLYSKQNYFKKELDMSTVNMQLGLEFSSGKFRTMTRRSVVWDFRQKKPIARPDSGSSTEGLLKCSSWSNRQGS